MNTEKGKEIYKLRAITVEPVFGYLISNPVELDEKHGMKDFSKRFNPLNYYTPKQYLVPSWSLLYS